MANIRATLVLGVELGKYVTLVLGVELGKYVALVVAMVAWLQGGLGVCTLITCQEVISDYLYIYIYIRIYIYI